MDSAQQLLDKYQPLVNNLKNIYPKTRSLGMWEGKFVGYLVCMQAPILVVIVSLCVHSQVTVGRVITSNSHCPQIVATASIRVALYPGLGTRLVYAVHEHVYY